MLPAQFQELRHRYRLFPLFVSQMIDECTQANLAAAPESFFNELAVIDWASDYTQYIYSMAYTLTCGQFIRMLVFYISIWTQLIVAREI